MALGPAILTVLPPARRAQRDLVIQHHVGADLGRLADHHAGAMVDEEALADAGARMDLNSGRRQSTDLRDKTWDDRDMPAIESMREAVQEHSVKPLIGQDFENVASRRILLEDHVNIVGP